jgi:hypothetical protein
MVGGSTQNVVGAMRRTGHFGLSRDRRNTNVAPKATEEWIAALSVPFGEA